MINSFEPHLAKNSVTTHEQNLSTCLLQDCGSIETYGMSWLGYVQFGLVCVVLICVITAVIFFASYVDFSNKLLLLHFDASLSVDEKVTVFSVFISIAIIVSMIGAVITRYAEREYNNTLQECDSEVFVANVVDQGVVLTKVLGNGTQDVDKFGMYEVPKSVLFGTNERLASSFTWDVNSEGHD